MCVLNTSLVLQLQRSLSEANSSKCVLESQLDGVSSELINRDLRIQELTTQLKTANDENVALEAKILFGEDQRKKLHNKVLELKVSLECHFVQIIFVLQ